MRMKSIRLGILIAAGALHPLLASPSIVLDPAFGNLAGLPGSIVGWGFIITNDFGYIEFNSAQFCVSPVSLPACTAPSTGVFTDIIAGFNDVIVGPAGGTLFPPSVTMAYDPNLMTGIGSFQFDPSVAIGLSDFGALILSYTLTDIDPNDPNAHRLGTGVLTANASVTVAVPEPGTAGILALILSGFAVLHRKRPRNRY